MTMNNTHAPHTPPLSFREQKEMDMLHDEMANNLYVITLIQGELSDGLPQWAYLRIPAEKYTSFKAAEVKGNYNTAEFGEILSHGVGLFPSEDVKAAMAERYGTDDRFADALVDTGLAIAEGLNELVEQQPSA